MNELQTIIEQAWDKRAELNPGTAPAKIGAAVDEVVTALDAGKLRVAEKINGAWVVHQWLKKAVLLSFRLEDNVAMAGAAAVLRQGPQQIRALHARRFRARRLSRGSAGDGAARRVHRQKCRVDALFRQHRRVCR